MKLRCSNRKIAALTRVEVLVMVVCVIGFLVALLWPAYVSAKKRESRINCINNLKQIGTAFRLWAEDNNNRYPMQVLVTNGGSMELAQLGDVASTFLVMSNELQSTKLLLCPDDKKRTAAPPFWKQGLKRSNISFFVGLDARMDMPQAILSGDDHLAVRGVPVKSGLQMIPSNAPISWMAGRHKNETDGKIYGNLVLADGSVSWQIGNSNLAQYFNQTGLATNRLAIP